MPPSPSDGNRSNPTRGNRCAIRSLPSVDQLSITCTSIPCLSRCSSVHGRMSASLKTHINAVTEKSGSEGTNARSFRCSPLLCEQFQVGLVVSRRQCPSPERALESRVVNEAAVEDPDLQTGVSDPETIVVIVAAVPDETLIEKTHSLKRLPRNEDANEADHARFV